MVNFNKFVGKYVCIHEKSFVYFFPPETKSRFREDDHEYVYWTEYKILGVEEIESKNKLILDAVVDNYSTSRYAKASNYRIIKKEKWVKQMVVTIFDSSFDSVDSGFFEALNEIE